MSDGPKFCRDCAHYRAPFYLYGRQVLDGVCESPKIEPDLVTGAHEGDPAQMRSGTMFCAAEARWFEPKHVPELVRIQEPLPWWKLW